MLLSPCAQCLRNGTFICGAAIYEEYLEQSESLIHFIRQFPSEENLLNIFSPLCLSALLHPIQMGASIFECFANEDQIQWLSTSVWLHAACIVSMRLPAFNLNFEFEFIFPRMARVHQTIDEPCTHTASDKGKRERERK